MNKLICYLMKLNENSPQFNQNLSTLVHFKSHSSALLGICLLFSKKKKYIKKKRVNYYCIITKMKWNFFLFLYSSDTNLIYN